MTYRLDCNNNKLHVHDRVMCVFSGAYENSRIDYSDVLTQGRYYQILELVGNDSVVVMNNDGNMTQALAKRFALVQVYPTAPNFNQHVAETYGFLVCDEPQDSSIEEHETPTKATKIVEATLYDRHDEQMATIVLLASQEVDQEFILNTTSTNGIVEFRYATLADGVNALANQLSVCAIIATNINVVVTSPLEREVATLLGTSDTSGYAITITTPQGKLERCYDDNGAGSQAFANEVTLCVLLAGHEHVRVDNEFEPTAEPEMGFGEQV